LKENPATKHDRDKLIASETVMKLIEKLLDDCFVALEKYPLPDPFRRHETRFVKRGQVSRNRGLGHAATRVDLPRAHAIHERELLFVK
jgi:hypothetical protein